MSDKETIEHLESMIASQAEKIKILEAKIVYLLEIIEKQGIKKDSHNSSLPPSSDIVAKKRNLRTKTERKIGGQEGHKGHTLEMKAKADKFIELKSDYCSSCGHDLKGGEFELKSKRQVVEIPPIAPIYIEYRQFTTKCPHCDHVQIADFPEGVNAPIQYGASVEALVAYYSVYQYIPFARLQNLFKQTFSLPLSQGTLVNLLERMSQKCLSYYEEIKEEIAQSEVIGSDETGMNVNGKKGWAWVWQNTRNTFISFSDTRAFKTVEELWKKAFKKATLVSDRWAAQLKSEAKGHQLCLAHLLRDITYLEETEKHTFSTQFKALLLSIFALKKMLVYNEKALEIQDEQAMEMERKLNSLLAMSIEKEKYSETDTFQKSMLKYRNYILPCLYNLEIPPDNNASERAIRNIKVKQKISGQFKSGQKAFCIIRSIIDTLLKRGKEVLPCLYAIGKVHE